MCHEGTGVQILTVVCQAEVDTTCIFTSDTYDVQDLIINEQSGEEVLM